MSEELTEFEKIALQFKNGKLAGETEKDSSFKDAYNNIKLVAKDKRRQQKWVQLTNAVIIELNKKPFTINNVINFSLVFNSAIKESFGDKVVLAADQQIPLVICMVSLYCKDINDLAEDLSKIQNERLDIIPALDQYAYIMLHSAVTYLKEHPLLTNKQTEKSNRPESLSENDIKIVDAVKGNNINQASEWMVDKFAAGDRRSLAELACWEDPEAIPLDTFKITSTLEDQGEDFEARGQSEMDLRLKQEKNLLKRLLNAISQKLIRKRLTKRQKKSLNNIGKNAKFFDRCLDNIKKTFQSSAQRSTKK